MMKTRYEVTPRKRARRATMIVCAVTVFAVFFWTLSAMPDLPVHGVWQLCAVLCMTAAIVLFARYAAHRHICSLYFDDDRFEDELVDGETTRELEDALNDGNCWSFKVTEIQSSNRRLIVCHLEGTDILSCRTVTDAASREKARAEARGLKVYNYCDDIFPQVFCQFIMKNEDETLCVRFSPDEEMAEVMTRLYGARVFIKEQRKKSEEE